MAVEYDPATTIFDGEDGSNASNSSEHDHDKDHDSPDAQSDAAADEDDDYDPSSFNFGDSAVQTPAMDEAHSISHTAAPNPASDDTPPPIGTPAQPQQKTVGGFIVEEDDDDGVTEQDIMAPIPTQMSGTGDAKSDLDAVAVSDAKDISLASAPTTDTAANLASSGTSLNGSTTATVPISDLPVSNSSTSVSAAQATQGNPIASLEATSQPAPTNGTHGQVPMGDTPAPASSSARLPHDKVGRLEDRIKDDPKADTEAWYSLIQHYKEKDQFDNVRKTYDRMLEVFPTAATIWIAYIDLELEHMARGSIDSLLGRALGSVQDIGLWKTYLNYLRRVLPLTNDPSGNNRNTLTQAFETVLDNVGMDPAAGEIWTEYIEFIGSGPGNIGGTGWQDAQKMDQLRKAYQRAIRFPHFELTRLWKEYDKFEMTLNKATGRKALQEQSPHYMTARTANMALAQYLNGLDRKALPVLPPIEGCVGDDEFADQVGLWKGWIALEKTDPLVLKDEDINAYRKRIVYAFKQAVMPLYFYPRMWYDAAQWCYEQITDDMVKQGDTFLDQGLQANPESVLLALKKADRLESNLETGNTEEVVVRNGEKLDIPFENVHKALYSLREKIMKREKDAVAKAQEYFGSLPSDDDDAAQPIDDDDDDSSSDAVANKPRTRERQLQAQISAIKGASKQQLEELKRLISYVWVAKMRAFRRIQGQGAPNKPRKGFRGVFAEARPRGQVSSDVYIASALIEWHCYRDPAATKIFDRGMKLFPADEMFAQEYIKHLISTNDFTNARVIFETTMTKILALNTVTVTEREKRQRLRPLLLYMHNFESSYGDLAQIHKIEKRMADLYPGEPDFERFSRRFAGVPPSGFDGIDLPLVISPTQIRTKDKDGDHSRARGSSEAPGPEGALRLGANGPYIASPKRPLDDSDAESPARKFLRGDSPLKGAAGRRIASNASAMQSHGGMTGMSGFGNKTNDSGPATFESGVQLLPKPVYELLRKLPNARDYTFPIFDPARTVEFLRNFDLQAARARVGR